MSNSTYNSHQTEEQYFVKLGYASGFLALFAGWIINVKEFLNKSY